MWVTGFLFCWLTCRLCQTSSRPRGDVGSNLARRGHGSQLSISDPSHHVTEAIGTLYGDDDDSGAEENRPLSFLGSPYGGDSTGRGHRPGEPAEERLRLVRTVSDQSSTLHVPSHGSSLKKTHTMPAKMSGQNGSLYDGPLSPLPSPTPSLREGSQFPLTNIDNPNDIAQELSNLQALRRLSMDVGNNMHHDPDLMPFSGVSLVAMPTLAPTGDDDEADPSRLLWVPARVHPELEPTAFKNFLENRVNSMKRRSGESLLSVDGSQRTNSMSSLQRKKSMLSRQIHTHSNSEDGDGYVDGAERLHRQQSMSDRSEVTLDDLVADPTRAVQKLTQETLQEGDPDIIIPVAPGMGLRRSTRTTYRKGGSIRNGDRVPFAKRMASRQQTDSASEDAPPPIPPLDAGRASGLSRVNSEPARPEQATENFSRPSNRAVRRQAPFSREAATSLDGSSKDELDFTSTPPQDLPRAASSASSQRSTLAPIPQIIETPPSDTSPSVSRSFPERSSSQKPVPQGHSDLPSEQNVEGQRSPAEEPPARSNRRPSASKPSQSPTSPQASPGRERQARPEDPTSPPSALHPSALPGSSGQTTSSLTYIPTLITDDRKADRRAKDETESPPSAKSLSGWKWFKSDDKEKKKKEREKEKEELSKRTRSKSSDNARLDVLQTSIDPNPPRGRESLLLERESMDQKLTEERKKEGRKASDSKKEKDGFFGGLFGGSKKKSDKDPSHKRKDNRPLSPDPPPRLLRPDVDYNWTRFPIIEERAIYRMAHIKLANPRRPLHSQVLLSNFMYSYLAKVQAMHPQLQVPISPQQKRQEEERKRREAELAQQQLMEQQQMAQQQAAQDGNFDFEYHRVSNPSSPFCVSALTAVQSGNQYGDSPVQHDGNAQYVDDSQIYEYEHGVEQHDANGQLRDQDDGGNGSQHQQEAGYAQGKGGAQGGHYYTGRAGKQQDEERSDMW